MWRRGSKNQPSWWGEVKAGLVWKDGPGEESRWSGAVGDEAAVFVCCLHCL